jgi:hypothetical protein
MQVTAPNAATFYRLLLALLIAVHVFLMYLLARTYIGGFGFNLWWVLWGGLFAFAMLIPLLWAVAFAELPEMWEMNVRRQRRWRRGFCPSCSYPRNRDLQQHQGKCQECGELLVKPSHYQISLQAVKRFIMILVIGLILGVLVGETWLRIDEIAFQNEIGRQAVVDAQRKQTRQRAWPGWGKLTYVQGEFTGH